MSQDAIYFIPHEKPMVFVDQLIELGENHAVVNLTISPDLMFSDEYGLPSWSSIELMAQTVSVFAGAKGQKLGLTPRIGYLLGTRKLNLPMAYFEHGKILKIRAEQQYLHESLGQFACEISYEDHIIQAILSVYEPPVNTEQS